MLTFVDDLGRFPRIWDYGNYQAIPYRLNTHMTYADISAKFFQICLPHVGKDCEAAHLKRHVSIMSSAKRK